MKNSVRPPAISKEARQYQAEDDCRTLQRAEEIKADAQRMKHVTLHAKKQMSALAKVAKPSRGKK